MKIKLYEDPGQEEQNGTRGNTGRRKPRLVESGKVERVMQYLKILVDAASTGQIAPDILTPDALVNLRRHCELPNEKKIDKTLIAPMLNIGGNDSGKMIGTMLFGAGWQKKLDAGNTEELTVVDDEVRDIIAAARPRLSTEYNDFSKKMPYNVAPLDPGTVTHTLRCLGAVLERPLSRHDKRERLPSTAIATLGIHCRNRRMRLDPGQFEVIGNIQNEDPSLTGEAIGNHLFGPGWQEKIRRSKTDDTVLLEVPDAAVRTIIAEAEPRATLRYMNPADLSDRNSSRWIKSMEWKARRLDDDRQTVSEAAGSFGQEPLPQPGEDWLANCSPPAEYKQAKRRAFARR